MRRFSTVLALLLVVAACGDDDATDPISATSAPAQTEGTTSAPTVTVSTTGPQVSVEPSDCLEIWPELAIQTVAGSDFAFIAANDARDACTYFAIADGIALAWRTSDADGFKAGRSSAGSTGLEVMDIAVCDAGFYTEIEGALLIMEAYSASPGRVYTATVSGAGGPDDARAWATALLGSAC